MDLMADAHSAYSDDTMAMPQTITINPANDSKECVQIAYTNTTQSERR